MATVHGADSHREAQKLYDILVLQNEHFLLKGNFVRNSAWYSIVEAAQHYDGSFQAWRFLLPAVAKSLLKSGANLKQLQEKAAQSLLDAVSMTDHGLDEGQTKEQHKALMQAMKKSRARPADSVVSIVDTQC